MSRMSRYEGIKELLLSGGFPASGLSAFIAGKFSISRQAAHAHLAKLVSEGALLARGTTRNRTYSLPIGTLAEFTLPISRDWPEDRVWRERIAPALAGLPENVTNIWHYGFTEMYNNAIDHSRGSGIFVGVARRGRTTNLVIHDDGEGIFRKIRRELGLPDERTSILELAKGKLTTDPKHHSGEGIFFTSRAMDYFAITSGDLYFSHDQGRPEDFLTDASPTGRGTDVWLQLGDRSERTLRSVFERFTSAQGDYEFSKTVVALDLARHEGEELISRSQAKRVVARFEQFREVVLDFERIPTIGQAFADEIFRVFALEHPGTRLVPIRMNEDVTRMVSRAQAAAGAGREAPGG
ncbi:MAG TPA: STAS-like domain-containing protein [Usitatibacter sp.]|nr:STAS-like domain-containing protein [Usitatibacter sp.]